MCCLAGCGGPRGAPRWERNAGAKACADYFMPPDAAGFDGAGCPRPEQVLLVRDVTNGSGPLLFCRCPRPKADSRLEGLRDQIRLKAREAVLGIDADRDVPGRWAGYAEGLEWVLDLIEHEVGVGP